MFSLLKNKAPIVLGIGITKSSIVIGSPIIVIGVINNQLLDIGSSNLLLDNNTYRVKSKGNQLSSTKQGS